MSKRREKSLRPLELRSDQVKLITSVINLATSATVHDLRNMYKESITITLQLFETDRHQVVIFRAKIDTSTIYMGAPGSPTSRANQAKRWEGLFRVLHF